MGRYRHGPRSTWAEINMGRSRWAEIDVGRDRPDSAKLPSMRQLTRRQQTGSRQALRLAFNCC